MTFSPIKGPEGNIEYLGHLISPDGDEREIDAAETVKMSHLEL